MRSYSRYLLMAFFLGACLGFAGQAAAEEKANTVNIEVLMDQYAAVKGDVNKFRAVNWMKDGYDGGISKMTYDGKVGKDATLSIEVRSLPKENDNDFSLTYQKGDKGYVKTSYKSFRKYYDDTGLVVPGFTVLNGVSLGNQDLQMDINRFNASAGLGPINDPNLEIAFEELTRKGMKSMLLNTASKEGSTTKNIGPAFEQVDYQEDTIALKGKKDIAGITIKGEQKVVITQDHSMNQKQFLDTSSTASTTNKIRTQTSQMDDKIYSTSLRGEKWLGEDKTFLALGYHYIHTRSSELMQNQEYNKYFSSFIYTSPRNSLPSDALNQQDEHVLNGTMNTQLLKDLAFTTDLRYQYSGLHGSSSLIEDVTPTNNIPDGVSERTEHSDMENSINRLGEKFALRYSGISHASLYSELEMSQGRDWMSQNRASMGTTPNLAENIIQEGVMYTHETKMTVGTRVVPNRFLTFTLQGDRHIENNSFDHYWLYGADTALLDSLKIVGTGVSTKVTYKPIKRLQTSFRYQLVDNNYSPVASDNSERTKNTMLSNVFTYEVQAEPIDPLLLMLSYSHAQNTITTIGASVSSGNLPAFDSGVDTILFSSNYSITEKLKLDNSLQYSWSRNYKSFSTGIPLGADFTQFDFTTKFAWDVKKNVTLKPAYEYTSYRGNPLVDTANYSAHIVWLGADIGW